jgi:hypothetical protein
MQTRLSPRSRTVVLAFVAGALLFPVPGRAQADPAGPQDERAATDEVPPRDDCCFTNVSYTGICRVTPGENETCATIVAYLNDPMSKGKSYCGSTTIRGGWKQVACEAPPAGGPVESR